MEKSGLIQIWDEETSISAGSQHLTEIERIIALADVSVLLVSADFLASPEITDLVLPLLLAKLLAKTMSILPVIVGSCEFQHSPLAPYRPINNPDQPLKTMSEGEVELVWQKVVRQIRSGDQQKNKIVDADQAVIRPLKQANTLPTHHLERTASTADEFFIVQSTMQLHSPEMMQLAEALLNGYPSTLELKLLISYELHENAEVIAAGNSLAEKVHNLVVWAISSGKVEELIRGALKRKPGNSRLQEFAVKSNDSEVTQFVEALLNGFSSIKSLNLLVAYELHENIDVIAPGNDLAQRVYSLVAWAMRTGKVKTLIDGALRRNPGNPALRRFASEHGF
jgi:hypothetical protein